MLATLGLTKGLALVLGVVLTVGTAAAGAYVVSTNRALEAKDRQLAELGKKLEATVAVIDQRDLQRIRDLTALQGENAALVREVAGVRDTLRILASVKPGETRIERVTERIATGPPGPPGTPGTSVAGRDGRDGTAGTAGAPGASGTPGAAPPSGPIITEAEAPAARERASEQIFVDFTRGSLLNCATIGLEADRVELLRDPTTGRLASTAPCVYRVTDRLRLQAPPAVATVAVARWARRVYGGWGTADGSILGARALYRAWRGFDVEGQAECRGKVPGAIPRAATGLCAEFDARVTLGYSW